MHAVKSVDLAFSKRSDGVWIRDTEHLTSVVLSWSKWRVWRFLRFGATVRELAALHLEFLRGLYSPCLEFIGHTMKHLFIPCREWSEPVAHRHTPIWPVSCVLRGRFDQNIHDAGQLMDEEVVLCSLTGSPWSLDRVLNNHNFVWKVLKCIEGETYV